MTQLGLFGGSEPEASAVAAAPAAAVGMETPRAAIAQPEPAPPPVPEEIARWLTPTVIWAAESEESDGPLRLRDLASHPGVAARREQVLKFAAFWAGEARRVGDYCYQCVYAVALERLAREMARDPEYFAKQPANRTEFQWLRMREAR